MEENSAIHKKETLLTEIFNFDMVGLRLRSFMLEVLSENLK